MKNEISLKERKTLIEFKYRMLSLRMIAEVSRKNQNSSSKKSLDSKDTL